MASTVHARRIAAGTVPALVDDPAIVEGYLEDASGVPPGRARGLVRPQDETEAAAFLREAARSGAPLLFQAARSSLTAGAVPRDDLIVSVERMGRISPIRQAAGRATVTVEAGVRLSELQARLADEHLYYPPVPTFQGAMIGGTVSTNAGGAASFKYGVTRGWVCGLRVLLANGDLLELERGEAVARRGASFRIVASDGVQIEVPTPVHELPALKKVSAGYHSADPLDLIDLFIGSEGTLGLITAATLRLEPLPAAVVTGLILLASTERAIALGSELRRAAERSRAAGDRNGPDVRAVEWLDGNCIRLLRDAGEAARERIRFPEDAQAGLLFEMELPDATTDEGAQATLAALLEGQGAAVDGPLTRLFSLLQRHDALDRLEIGFPEDAGRRQALNRLREAAPTRVAEILAARRAQGAKVRKVGGDLIVPFEHLPEMMRRYEEGFGRRGLEHAVWGHFSDGNLHPNALPRNDEETRNGEDALLEFADAAIRLGGAPLSEHGVGRNPLKQELLRRFVGAPGVEAMRRVKRALDPAGRLARGVLFAHPLLPPKPSQVR